jgi:hypothetical protein
MLPYMIMLIGFDDAFEGFVVQEKLKRPTVAVYSRKKCVEVIMRDKGYKREKAIEYFEKNVENMWQGDDAPLILNSISAIEYNEISKLKIVD